MDKTIPSLQLAEFIDIFSGNAQNYGVHHYKFTDSGKEEGKNTTITNRLVTAEEYKAHLLGQTGLGIIPINGDGDCKFGVIDIDVYDADLTPYIRAIEQHDFPLVPFRSKSGGLHIYLFLKQAVSAKSIIEVLERMVTILSLDIYIKTKLNRIIEVFPKQTKLAPGSAGSWINLPYYDVANTRQHVLSRGKALNFDDALTHIKTKRRTLSEVRTFLSELSHADGPPCLQTIQILNNVEKGGGRNTYLFSFGVYLKKADPEFWEQKLFGINEDMADPISKAELENTIIGSLRKKDYAYKCNEAPCVDFCRKALCKKREFGVGKEGGYFSELEYGKLTQVKAYEPYYEWEVKVPGEDSWKLLRFKNEADIIGQDAFLRLCFRELKTLPIKMKQSEWYKLINQALADMQVVLVDKEDDTSPIGMFKSIMLEFLTERAMAQTRDQILHRRAYLDPDTNTYYFRTNDLVDFMFLTKGFRYFAPNDVHGILRDFKAEPTRLRTESGKQLRLYSIKSTDVENIGLVHLDRYEAKFEPKEEQF